MLLTDEDVQERLTSPLNLLNRLRHATTSNIPSMPPTSDQIGLDVESKLAVGKIKETAAEIMAMTLKELKIRIPDIQKPEKLAQIATEMNKVLNTQKDDEKKTSQIIVYAPQMVNENHFQELTIREDVG